MSEGDLLIGGMTLRRLPCEIQEEAHQPTSRDWRLAGKLVVSAAEQRQLQIGRRYRLQLADGRAGQVIISRLAANIAEFAPQ